MSYVETPVSANRLSRRRLFALAAAGLGAARGLALPETAMAASASATHTMLFQGGYVESLNGVAYHSFRIPSLVRSTGASTLLAFAEGRVSSNADWGNINLVYKRSTDNGATWSSLLQVAGDGEGTYGNPTAVLDTMGPTKTIWLFLSWNPAGYSQTAAAGGTPITESGQRRVYLTSSTDDGVTWAPITDMTSLLKPDTLADGTPWAWDAMGPGVGLQTTDGTLVVPALYRNIYSTDHGATWKYQNLVQAQNVTSESTVIQLSDGTLRRNDRAVKAVWTTAKRRWTATGTIAGGFGSFAADGDLLDDDCEASVLRYTASPNRIVFLNSSSTVTRTKMEFRISYDDCGSWPITRFTADDPLTTDEMGGNENAAEGGYSSMAKTADDHVGALIEVDQDTQDPTASQSIAFRKVNLPWLLNGATEPV